MNMCMPANRYLLPLLMMITSAVLFQPAAKEVQPIAIDPTVSSFDSIQAGRNSHFYCIESVEDTVQKRATEGIVGYTRVRRKKMAPIISAPLPPLAVKQSLEALLKDKQFDAASAEEAEFHIKIRVFEFSLKEVSDKLPQNMEAKIALELIIIDNNDKTPAGKFVIRSQNSKSAVDTSKYAEEIMRGALESALAEIFQILSR